jgi:hypothetical protein
MLYNINTSLTTIALQQQKIQRLEVKNNTLSINFECAPPERYAERNTMVFHCQLKQQAGICSITVLESRDSVAAQ